MLTPAMSASSTSSPRVRRRNASSTQVRGPPFLNWLPFSELITTGWVLLRTITVGAWPRSGPAPVAATVAAPIFTNSRRLESFMRVAPRPLVRSLESASTGADRSPRPPTVQGAAAPEYTPQMIRGSLLTLAATGLAFLAGPGGSPPGSVASADRFWPQWRGPLGTGEAPQANPPLEWSEQKNVRWRVEIPGRGKSSPIVWGGLVFVTTAIPAGRDAQEFVVLAYRRADGQVRWRRTVRTLVPHEGTHPDGTFASASALTDGERLFAFFGSRGLYALDLEGRLLWERDLGTMSTRLGFREGASPALFENTLVGNGDHGGKEFIVAMDAKPGKGPWRKDRTD